MKGMGVNLIRRVLLYRTAYSIYCRYEVYTLILLANCVG